MYLITSMMFQTQHKLYQLVVVTHLPQMGGIFISAIHKINYI